MYRALGAYTIIIIVICDNVFFCFGPTTAINYWRNGGQVSVSGARSFIYLTSHFRSSAVTLFTVSWACCHLSQR